MNTGERKSRVLVVDDEPSLRMVLRQLMRNAGHEVQVAEDGASAWEWLRENEVDLIISDLLMPGLSGIDLLHKVRAVDADVGFVLLSGVGTSDELSAALQQEADAFLRKPCDLEMIRFAATRAISACETRRELRALRASVADVEREPETDAVSENEVEELVKVISSLTDLHDRSDTRHSREATNLALRIGAQMGLSRGDLRRLSMAARLYDIGKLAVPESVLMKREPLTGDELRAIREHAVIGAEILGRSRALSGLRAAVLYHHERWDGGGYPDGLEAEEIPLAARILAVVDAYLAITTDRAYRSRSGQAVALHELQREAGRQFDPAVVEALLHVFTTTPNASAAASLA